LGWTEKILKVLPKKTLMDSLYRKIRKSNNLPIKDDASVTEMLKELKKEFGPDIKSSDFDYRYHGNKKEPFVSMKLFYNFLLQERAGPLPNSICGPKQELHEYKSVCNKKKAVKDRDKIKSKTSDVWSKTVSVDGKDYHVHPHRYSRQIVMTSTDPDDKKGPVPIPIELREKENVYISFST
jgi:hypothetical protein